MRKLLIVFTLIYLASANELYGQKGDWHNEPGDYTLVGTGARNDPYQIASVNDLIYIADQVNMWKGHTFRGTHFLLTNNIDLGQRYWIPIGSEREQPFQGIFNGNGKTIYNLNIGDVEDGNLFEASGLFGYVGNGAQILNLAIERGEITGGGREPVSRAGSLAGLVMCHLSESGEDSIIIRNCHNKGVAVTGGSSAISSAGGLIGEVYSYSEKEGSSIILIENCTNIGAVNGSKSGFSCTGGITGKVRGHGKCNSLTSSSTGLCVIRSSHNRGAITGGTAEGKDAISATGGIAGYGYASGYGYGTMEGAGILSMKYCMNTGLVTGGAAISAQSFTYTGGLLGYVNGYGYGNRRGQSEGNSYGSGTFILTCSANRGNIDGGSVEGAIASTGGLFGFVSSSASTSGKEQEAGKGLGNVDVRNCYSNSSVSAPFGAAGGLAGCMATLSEGTGENRVSAAVQDSYAAGSVIGYDTISTMQVGGIVGRIQQSKYADRPPQLIDCLAALQYIGEDLGRTFRIVGQISGVQPPYSNVLARNYAYIREGDWQNAETAQNGADWNPSILRPPLLNWDFKNKTWLPDETMMYMPLLNRLPYQVRVLVP